MILDAWTQLFIWVGSKARKEEKREAIRTAVVTTRFLTLTIVGKLKDVKKNLFNFPVT